MFWFFQIVNFHSVSNKTEYHSVQTAGQNYDFKELYVALKNPKEP